MNEDMYECAISGLTEEPGDFSDSDGLDDLPVGWTRVQISRRAHNPKWIMLQQLKENMVAQMLQQLPPSMHEGQIPYLQLQAEAAYAHLEKDTPMYVSDVQDVVFISDSSDVLGELNDLRAALGLDPVENADGVEDEAEEVDDNAKDDKEEKS